MQVLSLQRIPLTRLVCSQKSIEEERSELSGFESSGITITGFSSNLDDINGIPKVLDADTTGSEGNLDVLLPVLPVTELGQLIVEMSQITVGEHNVTSLSQVVEGNSEFVEVLWQVDLNVIVQVEGRVDNSDETRSALLRVNSRDSDDESLGNVESECDVVNSFLVTFLLTIFADILKKSILFVDNFLIEIVPLNLTELSLLVGSLEVV